MFKLFDSVIKPLLLYGSDVWGYRNTGLDCIDKVMLRYCRRLLNVKATTSSFIVHEECGMLPPSVQCTISVLSFNNRLHHMPANTIVNKVYEELTRLHSVGFTTWVTRVRELVTEYDTDIAKMPSNFRSECKNVVTDQFKTEWTTKMQNANMYPILRTCSKIKSSFGIAPHLDTVKNHTYRIAMAQLRTSSRTLAIERGRYARPKLHINDHPCNICGTMEDEIHFLIHCLLYKHEWGAPFSNITRIPWSIWRK